MPRGLELLIAQTILQGFDAQYGRFLEVTSGSEIVVSKFGGTSVADFDAMNRSADIVLSDANVRLVVLSASAGITNLLVALAEGLEPGERFEKLDAIRNIQFAILERLRYPNVIREEIERLLENITVLAEAAALATSPALTDELVSHGELMSTLLFVEILRERDVQAQWFDVRKVMRTNDRFGRAEPDVAALAELAALQLLPRLNEGLVITQGFIGSENKGRTTTLGRGGSDYTAALLAEALHASRVDIWTDVPGIYTTDPRVVSASDITTSCQGIHFQPWHKGRAEDGWAQSDTSLLFSPRSAPPLAKRPTANASGDNPGDLAPVADDERGQPFNHLGDAPPQVLSQDWLLQHRYLGNAPLLACASAGSTFINKG